MAPITRIFSAPVIGTVVSTIITVGVLVTVTTAIAIVIHTLVTTVPGVNTRIVVRADITIAINRFITSVELDEFYSKSMTYNDIIHSLLAILSENFDAEFLKLVIYTFTERPRLIDRKSKRQSDTRPSYVIVSGSIFFLQNYNRSQILEPFKNYSRIIILKNKNGTQSAGLGVISLQYSIFTDTYPCDRTVGYVKNLLSFNVTDDSVGTEPPTTIRTSSSLETVPSAYSTNITHNNSDTTIWNPSTSLQSVTNNSSGGSITITNDSSSIITMNPPTTLQSNIDGPGGSANITNNNPSTTTMHLPTSLQPVINNSSGGSTTTTDDSSNITTVIPSTTSQSFTNSTEGSEDPTTITDESPSITITNPTTSLQFTTDSSKGSSNITDDHSNTTTMNPPTTLQSSTDILRGSTTITDNNSSTTIMNLTINVQPVTNSSGGSITITNDNPSTPTMHLPTSLQLVTDSSEDSTTITDDSSYITTMHPPTIFQSITDGSGTLITTLDNNINTAPSNPTTVDTTVDVKDTSAIPVCRSVCQVTITMAIRRRMAQSELGKYYNATSTFQDLSTSLNKQIMSSFHATFIKSTISEISDEPVMSSDKQSCSITIVGQVYLSKNYSYNDIYDDLVSFAPTITLKRSDGKPSSQVGNVVSLKVVRRYPVNLMEEKSRFYMCFPLSSSVITNSQSSSNVNTTTVCQSVFQADINIGIEFSITNPELAKYYNTTNTFQYLVKDITEHMILNLPRTFINYFIAKISPAPVLVGHKERKNGSDEQSAVVTISGSMFLLQSYNSQQLSNILQSYTPTIDLKTSDDGFDSVAGIVSAGYSSLEDTYSAPLSIKETASFTCISPQSSSEVHLGGSAE